MYRIKHASGDESVYRTLDELTAAVRAGLLTDQAMIYHQRADRWLSVVHHPHYKAAVAAVGTPEAGRRQVLQAVRIRRPVQPQETGEPPRTVARPAAAPAPLQPPRPGPDLLRAQENVLEGVVIPPRTTTTPALRDLDLIDAQVPEPPVRAAPPAPTPATPAPRPAAQVAPAAPAPHRAPEPSAPRPAPAPVPIEPLGAGVEVWVDLKADAVPAAAPREPAPSLAGVAAPRREPPRGLILAGIATALITTGLVAWHPWSRGPKAPPAPPPSLVSVQGASTGALGTGQPAFAAVPESGGQPAVVPEATEPAASTPAGTRVADSAARRPDTAGQIVRVAAPGTGLGIPAGGELVAVSGPATGPAVSPQALLQGYQKSYQAAQSELSMGLLQMGFVQLFARSRLASPAGLQDARRLIAGAGAAVRQYRAEETRIERVFQDSVGPAGRKAGWSPREFGIWNARTVLKESAEQARLAASMLAQADSVITLLLAQAGRYALNGDVIVFEEAEAARQYGTLRAWLTRQADQNADAVGRAATVGNIARAIGAVRLPSERVGS